MPSLQAPKRTPSKPVVVLDAGHGPDGKGTNHLGAVSHDLVECARTWELVGRVVRAIPSADGWLVLTRPKYWNTPSLSERAYIANRAKAALFVSVHCNATPYETKKGARGKRARGIEVLHYKGSYTGRHAARCFLDQLIDKTGATNRGLKPRKNVRVLNKTLMPAVVIEVGFVTNRAEGAVLQSDMYLDQLAEAIKYGIMDALRAIGALPDTRTPANKRKGKVT